MVFCRSPGALGAAPPTAAQRRFHPERWLRFLLPDPCLACGAADGVRPGALGLCGGCACRLARVEGPRCRTCCRPLPPGPGGAPWCGACLCAPPALDQLLAGWLYRPPFDAVIRALKFGRLEALGPRLAAALVAALGPRLEGFDLVVPVPLHWRRRLVRGFDQAERIATPLADRLGIPVAAGLRRRRATARQARLARGARLGNLRQAFVARRAAALSGRRVLLVDDVATTGATLAAAALALRRAGCAGVVGLAAGYTPAARTAPESV